MMAAGHQPTADWIGNSLRLMLTDDRFAASLFGGRHSVAEAMNEVLWEDAPTQNVAGAVGVARHPARRAPHPGRRLLLLGLAARQLRPAGAHRRLRSPAATAPTSPSATASTAARSRRRRSPRSSPGPASRCSWTGCRTSTWPCRPTSLTRRPSPWLRGLSELPVAFTPTPALGGSLA